MALATVLSYLSGLAFVAPALPPRTVIGTALLLQTCDAVLCRVFARNLDRPRNLWMLIGFVGGVFALAVLLLLPPRARPRA